MQYLFAISEMVFYKEKDKSSESNFHLFKINLILFGKQRKR